MYRTSLIKVTENFYSLTMMSCFLNYMNMLSLAVFLIGNVFFYF